MPEIAPELTAFGIGLDIAGATYLGLSILQTPWGVASRLWGQLGADRGPGPKGGSGEQKVSTLPVMEAVESILCGRMGLLQHTLGFTFQLAGLVFSSPKVVRKVLLGG